MAIDSLQKISVNNSEQWILVRGKNENAPLILQVQAGPGIPLICYANAMQKNLKWEEDYIVTYWDQRGCGKSYQKDIEPESINLQQSADDILECAKYLLNTYKKEKLILIGYSLGATSALIAASKDSSLFSSLILTGIDINISEANSYALDFAQKQAMKNKEKKVLTQIEKLKQVPINNAALFEKRAKIVSNYGGIATHKNYTQLFKDAIKNMLSSKEYRLRDISKTIKGMKFCQNILLPEIVDLNLFEHKINISIPVHFVQGSKDAIAPLHIMQNYFKHLDNKNYKLTVFENSAHMPQLEEPEKFFNLINEFSK